MRDQVLDQSASEKSSLLQFADCGALVKGVAAHRFDGIENGEATAAEHFQVDTQVGINHCGERQTFGKQSARARDQILHQTDVAIVKAAFDNIVFAEAVGRGSVERDIDTSFVEVAGHVLPEIP